MGSPQGFDGVGDPEARERWRYASNIVTASFDAPWASADVLDVTQNSLVRFIHE